MSTVHDTDQLIDSGDVPQRPRDLPTIAKFIREMPTIKENFGTYTENQQRTVGYICQSAHILGLVNNSGIMKARLTATGRVFGGMEAVEQRRRLSYAFEGSVVGRAWLIWAGVRELWDLRKSDAEEFLRKKCTGLSPREKGTLKMRAGTLQEWLDQFIVARKQFETSDHRPTRRPCDIRELRPAIFDPGDSLRLTHALVQGCTKLDVATGFFTLDGYELLADGIDNPDVRILVGGLEDDKRSAAHAEFLARFVRSLDRGLAPPQNVKREIIDQIYWRIVHGKISMRALDARMSERLHAKIFLFDQRAVYVTSANLTATGLKWNIEGGYLITSREDIDYFLAKFDAHWQKALPLAEDVLQGIERSWIFQEPVLPYLAFLRALHLFYGILKEPECRPARTLAEFQSLIVSHVLGKFDERRGVMLVAPTGTGKTVMAAYVAAALWGSKIHRVLIICNNESLERAWRRELEMFGIDPRLITSGKLRGKSRNPGPSLGDIEHVRRYLRADTLVIVDECHQYRTPKRNGHIRLRSLLLPEEPSERPYALLLTATAISRGPENLQALLNLTDYKEVPEIKDVATAAGEPGLVNVTLPDILRRFGTTAPNIKKRALHFGDHLRFYPHIDLSLQSYDSPMEAVFAQIETFTETVKGFGELADEIASELSNSEDDEDVDLEDALSDTLRRQANLLRTLLARRAESSPQALACTLERMLKYVKERGLTRVEQHRLTSAAEPLLGSARILLQGAADRKYEDLVALMRKHGGRKVLLFTEYIDTSQYLYDRLKAKFPKREIGQLTGETSKAEKRRLILSFAPEAQEGQPGQPIDILIGTDAISEGENLQDAQVLINYDLPWTPLRLVQRLGRIDRPTKTSRKVQAYNYFPGSPRYREMIKHWPHLTDRSDHVRKMSEAEVFQSTQRDPDTYTDEPKKFVFEAASSHAELLEHVRDQQVPTSTFLHVQMSASREDLDVARGFPAGIYTARNGPTPGLYLLVEMKGRYLCLMQRPDESVHEIERVRFLRALMSEPDTRLEALPTDIDRRVGSAMSAWVKGVTPGGQSGAEEVRLQIALWVTQIESRL